MAAEGVNYQAVLEDLKARRAQLDAAIAAIEALAGMGPSTVPGATATAQTGPGAISHDAFFSMTIPDATKKLLTIMKRRLTTPDVIKYLKQGGLPEPQYNTLYAVLRRRQNQVGDIINVSGEWALKEWHPNWKPPTRSKKDAGAGMETTEEMSDAGEADEAEGGDDK